MVAALHNLQGVALDPETGAGIGDAFHFSDDETVQRLAAVLREGPAVAPVQLTQTRTRINDKGAVVLRHHILDVVLRVGGELADHLLEHVVDGDQSFDIAIFIHHHGHAQTVFLEVQKLLVQIRSDGHEVRFVCDQKQVFDVELIARVQQANGAFYVQNAFQRVEVAPIQRQSGVAGHEDLVADLVEIVIKINTDDFGPRHHDVLNRGLFEVEDPKQHLLVTPRDHRAGLPDYRA